MPFPWKKMRSTRISRLVNDHLRNSQRRRGDSSLVVETGFPTSLVDLFIKNREKLRKPSKKNRYRNAAIDSNDPVIIGSLFTSSSNHTTLLCPPPTPSTSPLPPRSRDLDKTALVDGDDADFGARVDNKGVDMIRVIVAIVKIFLAVVLAMAMEKLAVGMTVSAFFLFSLEYVGSSTPIQNVELGIAIAEEIIQCENEITEDSSNDSIELELRKLIMEECISERLELKERKLSRSKMRSKIKKFVSNKLRRRKECNSESYGVSRFRDDSIAICEEQQDTYEWKDSVDAKITRGGEEVRRETGQDSRYLCLIVLVGLIGGRMFALMIALLWCLLLKSSKTLL